MSRGTWDFRQYGLVDLAQEIHDTETHLGRDRTNRDLEGLPEARKLCAGLLRTLYGMIDELDTHFADDGETTEERFREKWLPRLKERIGE